MSFTPRLKVNKCGDNNANIKDISYYKYVYPYKAFNFPLPNCTTYAYGRTMEICVENGAKWTEVKHYNNPWWWNGQCVFGDAETWLSAAKKANHWQTGSVPKLGAIAVWDGSRYKKGGHVMIVEEIGGSSTVTLSGSNYKGVLFEVDKASLEVGKVTSFVGEKFLGYIYNPFVKEDPKKTVEQIAKEVIDGKWGNGATRKKKLEEAGYNYVEVQQKVNELLNTPVYYTVKKGDTMSKIAKQYNTTLAKLKTLNPNIKNVNIIQIGQKIRVK